MSENTLNGKLVNFKTSDGLTLHGFNCESKPHNKKIIIQTHGMTGDFVRFPLMWELGNELKQSDFDLFLANNRGNGMKTRFYKGKKKITLGTALEKFEDCEKDINAAIRTAQRLGYKEIILSGHSTGCQKIAYYQSKTKDRRVKSLLLLAPADDYNSTKRKHGKDFARAVKECEALVRKNKGNESLPKHTGDYSAKRFLSFAKPTSPEGEIFNYEGELKQFSKITVPMLAVFGSREEHIGKQKPKQMLAIMREKTNSEMLVTAEVKNSNHSFVGKEKGIVKIINEFLGLL